MDELPEQRPPNRWNRALVTGASSGIGSAIAKLLAAESSNLILVARDGDRLGALAEQLAATFGVEVEVLKADLADRDQVQVVVDRLAHNEHPVDLLVNNAGLGFSGDLVELDPEAELGVIEVNVVALHRLAQAAGSAMAARGRGGILNVSSVAGFAPSPKSATYAATKAFVTSFSEALHAELGSKGVVVSCLCPGLTRTDVQRRAGYSPDSLPNSLWQSAEEVAAAGLAGLAVGKAVTIPGAKNKILVGAMKVTPSPLVRWASLAVAKANGRP